MKKLIGYTQFINEKYTENPEFRIKTFFDELTKNINHWFTEGTFAANGSELGKITQSILYDTEKNLIFEFSDADNYYQVYVIISLEDVTEDEMNDCYIKVKKYTNDGELIRTLGEDVLIKELNEDKIIELFSRMDEESKSVNDGTPDTLSDEDSTLSDSSIT